MAKVCFYSVSTQLGGAERSLLEYLKYVHTRALLEAELLVPKLEGPLVKEAQKIGIPCRALPMPESLLAGSRLSKTSLLAAFFNLAPLLYFVRLVMHFRRTRPELVYTTGLKCHLFASLASIFSGTPVLWHLRDHFSPGVTRSLLRCIYKICARTETVANSRSTALSFSKQKPPAVVYNGVASHDFPFLRERNLHQELGLAPNTRIVGILGVVARWKGQSEFLRMAAELKRRGNNVHFVVVGAQIYDTVGDSNYTQEIKSLAADLEIDAQVSFLGFRHDTARLLRSIDVLVHASIRPEPFGRVLIEAMASGTPVTASAAGGPLEILQEGKTGLMHEPGNWMEMADNVEILLDPEKAESISKNAYHDFCLRFTHERYAESLHARVANLLEKSAS